MIKTREKKAKKNGVDAANESSLIDFEGENQRNKLFGKHNLFKKVPAPLQENFNVNFQESCIESDGENSNIVSKPNQLFMRKPSNEKDIFSNIQNDTVDTPPKNETKTTHSESIDTDISPALFNKMNPFNKVDVTKNAFNVSFEHTKHDLTDTASFTKKRLFRTNKRNSGIFYNSYSEGNSLSSKKTQSQELDGPSFSTTKSNPFKKCSDTSQQDPFDIEFSESSYGDDLEEHISGFPVFKTGKEDNKHFDVTYDLSQGNTDDVTKSHTQSGKTSNENAANDMASSSTFDESKETDVRQSMEGINYPTLADSSVLHAIKSGGPHTANTNPDLAESSFLDQSSFNDNLSAWMSNQSEDEICTPPIPSLLTRTSIPKELNSSKKTLTESPQKKDLTPKNMKNTPQKEILLQRTLMNNAATMNSSIKNVTLHNSPHGNTSVRSINNKPLGNSSNKNTPVQKQSINKITENELINNMLTWNLSSNAQNIKNFWEEKFQEIKENANKEFKREKILPKMKKGNEKTKEQEKSKIKKQVNAAQGQIKQHKIRKPATFATKQLYQFIAEKLKPKYGIDSIIKTEELILTICDTVKAVVRRRNYQKKSVNDLKMKMAKAGVIETTIDFYEFIIKFLPHPFRIKVIPCLQPGTNTVYPPIEPTNPFDKII